MTADAVTGSGVMRCSYAAAPAAVHVSSRSMTEAPGLWTQSRCHSAQTPLQTFQEAFVVVFVLETSQVIFSVV